MKEVTHEDWMKNPKPRYMWVWDYEENNKHKEFVLCVLSEEERIEVATEYPVRTISDSSCYFHCAELVEEPKEKTKRPCTREELIEMLKKQGLPMLRIVTDGCEDVGVTSFIVESISDDNVYIVGNQSYESLCEHYILIDGTPLWVEE